METPDKYPFSIRFLHWIMALVIIGLIILGFTMARILTDEPYTGAMYLWHKSFGVLVLILITFRIIFRILLNKKIPPISMTLSRIEQIGAAIGHKLLYILMVLVPVSGYLMSSTFPKSSGIFLFGIPLPDALPKNEALSQIFTAIHTISSYGLALMIVFHIAAVIKHRFFDAQDKDLIKKIW